MQTGWVYVLTNAAMPDLVKIGYTKHMPQKRARELYSTGVALPFQVVYQARCRHYQQVEAEVHRRLKGKRLNDNREFFAISVSEAVKTVRRCAGRNLIDDEYFRKGQTAKPVRGNASSRRIGLFLFSAAAACLGGWAAARFVFDDYSVETIGRNNVNLRRCASTQCPVIAVLPAGRRLEVNRRKNENGWVFVKFSGDVCTSDGCRTKRYAETSGWIYADNLTGSQLETSDVSRFGGLF